MLRVPGNSHNSVLRRLRSRQYAFGPICPDRIRPSGSLAASLLGVSGRTALPPPLFVLTPITFVGFLVPLMPRVGLPPGWSLTTPPAPLLRGHGVIGHGHRKNWSRNVRRLN